MREYPSGKHFGTVPPVGEPANRMVVTLTGRAERGWDGGSAAPIDLRAYVRVPFTPPGTTDDEQPHTFGSGPADCIGCPECAPDLLDWSNPPADLSPGLLLEGPRTGPDEPYDLTFVVTIVPREDR